MNTPVPAPRLGGEVKKPIPAPRTKIMPMSSQKSDESSSSKSSEENVKTLSRTARRVKSFSYASKQIAGEFGGLVQNKIESTRQSVRRLTRTFSISSHPEESESENATSEEKEDNNLDIFNSIRFDSPIVPAKSPEYTNWEPPRKRADEVLGEHLFNLAPPSYPPPSLPDDSLYNELPAVPSPVSTVPRKPVSIEETCNKDIYESVYPFKRNNPNNESKDSASVCTEDTSLTLETSSELSRSSSWKFYDSVGHLKQEVEEKLTLTPIKVEECSRQQPEIDRNSNFSVDVRNSIYENFVLPRPSQSIIFQFDPLLNASYADTDGKIEDYKMLEEILQEDLYGNISAHRTIDTWSISDSEAEEFANPPSPPVRFDSLQEEPVASNAKDERLRPAPAPSALNHLKNGGERKSWLKHVKDVVIASSEIIKGKHKEGLVQRPMVNMKNSAYKKGMLYKVQNGPVEDLFGEYSGRWCMLENGVFVCYSNNSCENIKEHFPIDTILSVETVKHPKLKLKSDNYELHCFKINASGKTRGSHVYGSRNLSDRRLWMQTIAESLTTRFGTKITSDYTRMGWTYVREGVTSKWMGAWLILSGRNLMYAVDGQPVKNLDLRKARCIALQGYEDTDQNPQTSDNKGPNMLVDACNSVVYMRMWTTRETKIWCHLIRIASYNNGACLHEQQLTKNDVPVIVEKCINFIYLHGSMSKGIYRQSGVGSLVSELLAKFAENAWAVQITHDKFSEHDVATALKRFFRDLPEPLLEISQRQYFYQVSLVKNQEDQIRMYKAALDNLPSISYNTAKKLLGHLHFISSQCSKNYMNVVNLAAIWGPTLMHFENDSSNPTPSGAHQQDVMVVADLISLYKHIFPEDPSEMEQEKVMLQVLEKHIQSPQGTVSKNAGDFRLWIYLGDKEGQTFNVAIGPNKTALEVCNELSSKVNLQVYEIILEEVVVDGHLTRPIHHSEKILEVVLNWGYWDEGDRKDNYIVISNLAKYADFLDTKTLLISGEMKYADSKTKNLKNFTFEFSNGRLSCCKDKTCDIKLSSWNIEDICWYWGHEPKRNPQSKWTITFFPKTEVPKRSRNQPFFGNIIVWPDVQARANWIAIMLKTLYPDGITQPIHVNLSS
ncbi:arf-GAP with Rho-GAP domain, ANK repeat and PH domain-containing protein 1 [Coccinella septempunctata]|uniref:arf-GAP with Rho-GAP domain, ANK repeat and PH domain-containing protein 1 n=1 Tax=Coccinella septempunctata TaxID=41139 RepID=UPI001D092088|nr:arf-GAP with Rho-GAP domain, ANK repeat and PH domain-containing protein 1 [Coccinella septempunctata]